MNTLFISEVSSNHHRDLERCFDFIDASAEAGCGAVKFQLFKIDQMFAPEILSKSEMHRKRKQWELPVEFLPELSRRCKQKNIAFSCTPFYLKAVDELEPYVDFYKIASYELMWAVHVAKSSGCEDLTLLHCVSAYPTPPAECNLSVIKSFKHHFNCKTGWSDHSVSQAVMQRAIHKWGAECIEFHLDLDGKGEEFAAGHCWLPDQIAAVINDANIALQADGEPEKQTSPSELADRDWRADPSDGLRPLIHIRQEFCA